MAQCTIIFQGGAIQVNDMMARELLERKIVRKGKRIGQFIVKQGKQDEFWRVIKDVR